MRISVDLRLDKLLAGLDDMARKQVPFVIAASLTDTAKDVQQAEIVEIKDSFDRPTPATLDSIYVRPATKQKFEAEVGIKSFMGKGVPAIKYLTAEVEGGQRRVKRFERALQAANLLPPGYFAVPGDAVQLDQYGNVPGSLIVQLLSYFKAFPEMGYKANMSDKRKAALAKGNKKGKQGVAYFVARDGWLHPGIWARYAFGHGSAVRPVLMYVRGAAYEKRFDFYYAAQQAIERSFERNLKTRWQQAWQSASRD